MKTLVKIYLWITLVSVALGFLFLSYLYTGVAVILRMSTEPLYELESFIDKVGDIIEEIGDSLQAKIDKQADDLGSS